ncbi:hypothetical protein AN958_02669 [Leucoagaricus sp. SymC.cos]|nr:hypothetical protein AN958_02669 [Leucoagaricus sp. SymC.cos]
MRSYYSLTRKPKQQRQGRADIFQESNIDVGQEYENQVSGKCIEIFTKKMTIPRGAHTPRWRGDYRAKRKPGHASEAKITGVSS